MASKHTSTKTSIQTINGETVKTTVVTETLTYPDGRKEIKEHTTTEKGGSVGHSGGGGPVSKSGKPSGSSGASAVSAKPPADMDTFITDVVKAHNVYRRKHGKVGDLTNNAEMNKIAQNWANTLAAKDMFEHSGDSYNGKKLGENIAYKQSSSGADYAGQDATDSWYNEVKDFNYNRKEDNFSKTGHFTQVVWKGSREIGVGKAHGKNGKVYVVCNYNPAGNLRGHYEENIFKA